MQIIWTFLQDNAILTAICGLIAAGIFQLLKRIPWFVNLAGNEIIKGRVASFLVVVATTIVGFAVKGEWAGFSAALLVAIQAWFVAQGAWAGILRSDKK